MSIRTLIVDDEAAARSRLRRALSEFAQLEVIGEACDGLEAVALIEQLTPDLLFLDVQMPGLDGFEVLRALPAQVKRPQVVFATAFNQHALAAFDANAIAYLLKPVNRERLAQAVERAERLLANPGEAAADRTRIAALGQTLQAPLRYVVGRSRERYLLIPIEEVCFFQVSDGLTKVKTASTLYRTDYGLNELEQRLPAPPFVRAHRSTLVNLGMVAEIAPLAKGSYVLLMKDEHRSELTVSERQSKWVRELLKL